MSEVFGETIRYDGTVEGFVELCGPGIEAHFGPRMMAYLLSYLRWEQTAETVWRRTDVLTSLFGFKGRSLREWLVEHRGVFVS